ncbi:cell division protein SepF [Faecalimonas sp.]
MGVLDKFLNIMKLDDGEEDDFLGEEDFEEYEEKPKKSFFRRDKEEVEDFDLQEESKEKSASLSNHSNNKVTPMRQPNGKRAASMEVCVIKPTAVDDAREITETLLSGRTVILNLEGIDLEVAQRIIDFTSGATYAIRGNLQKISNYIFLVTPTNVEISGDLQDLLNTSFDVPSIRTRF